MLRHTFIAIAVTWLAGCRPLEPLAPPPYYDSSLKRFAETHLGEAAPRSVSIRHIGTALPAVPPPITTAQFEQAEQWPLTLSESIEIALKNSEVVRVIAGEGLTAVAATDYDPSIAETGVQSALAAFDASVSTDMLWERLENPPGLFRVRDAAEGDADAQERLDFPPDRMGRARQIDLASNRTQIVKPFSTGGEGRVGLNTDYVFESTDPDSVAQYSPRLEFALRQPVLRDAGTAANRAPLLLARAETDQSLWDFQRGLLALVRDVETTYWDLHAAQVQLEVLDRILPLASEVVRVQEEQLDVQIAVAADVAQARVQFEQFREDRVRASAFALERSMLLRNLLGIPPSDGRRLVAVDKPSGAPLEIDWPFAIETALANRPDVVRQRLELRVWELRLLRAKNAMLPRLDGQALWRVNGLGTDLEEAFDLLSSNEFNDWQLGFNLEIPLNNHAAAAQVRNANFSLARERALLRNTVHNAIHDLAGAVRDLEAFYQEYQKAEERRKQAEIWQQGARARFENPPGGTDLLVALDNYLSALDAWGNATAEASRLLSAYNAAAARLALAQGISLQRHEIIQEGDPLGRIRRKLGDEAAVAVAGVPETY